MRNLMMVATGVAILFSGTTLGAGMVFFIKGEMSARVQKLLPSFASGVMLAASVWSPLIPAIHMTEASGGRRGAGCGIGVRAYEGFTEYAFTDFTSDAYERYGALLQLSGFTVDEYQTNTESGVYTIALSSPEQTLKLVYDYVNESMTVYCEYGAKPEGLDLRTDMAQQQLLQGCIDGGKNHTVGLYADGNVFAISDTSNNKCNMVGWRDIVAIDAGWYHTVGLKPDGTVVATGDNDSGQCNVNGRFGIGLSE